MRLFIGLTLPEHLQHDLCAAWDRASANPAGERRMRSSRWHLTLAFLDDVPRENLPTLKHLVEKAIENPPGGSFTIDRFETFPKRKPTRIVARAYPAKERTWHHFVGQLRDMVSLAAPNVDRKPWSPHISITRTLKGMYLETWEEAISPIRWTPDTLAIIQSIPGSDGSRYTNLHVYSINV